MQVSKTLLSGKTALVTGAGRGIGKAIANGFGAAGADVVCVSRSEPQIKATAAQIVADGGRGMAIPTDVTELSAVEAMFERLNNDFGSLDILVINAGGNLERELVETSSPGIWGDTLLLNLTSAYYCAKTAIPYMKEYGGSMITLGSGRGHRPHAEVSAYSCAKAGLSMLTRVLAEELNAYKISVNELIPGPVLTEGFRESVPEEQMPDLFTDAEWFKEPEDVLPLALFLASQKPGEGPTGQCFSLTRRDAV